MSLNHLKHFFILGAAALSLSACDGGNSVAEAAVDPSAEIQAFIDAPSRVRPHKPTDPHGKLGAEQLAEVALQHLQESRVQLAIDTLGSALERYPQDTALLNLRASILLQQGRASLALADLNRAVEINPHDPALFTNRAQALRRFDRNDEALQDLEAALELDPQFVGALFNRGGLHFEAGRYELALADFQRCIEIEPGLPAFWFNRASTREAMGRHEEAIDDLQHFLSLSPEPGWAKLAEDMLAQWQAALS